MIRLGKPGRAVQQMAVALALASMTAVFAQVEADAALKKDQKAVRDSKYAARKARQK